MSKTKCTHATPAALPQESATAGWLGRFWAEQDGSMSYLAVAGALVMMVFGGIGIDLMYAELKRNKVQNTLDRAVLAAADLDNVLEPEVVVNDYFRAMGMEDANVSVQSTSTRLARQVHASASQTMPSNFMGLLGVDTLQAEGEASAQNAVYGFEISLVLDVSGSMGGDKIQQLRDAATAFIDIALPEGEDNSHVSVSLVPYAATVSLGDTMSQYYTLDNWHDHSNCPIFEDGEFFDTQVHPDEQLSKLGHFDLWWSSNGSDLATTWFCPEGNNMAIVPHSSDPAYLKEQIAQLTAGGNTAIDLGMKWGTALLDPASQTAVGAMVADGISSNSGSPKPASYDDRNVQKYVIVMTDGQNTTQYDLREDVRTGLSDVWIDHNGTEDPADDVMSIRVQQGGFFGSRDLFLWTHLYGTGANLYNTGVYNIARNTGVSSALTTLGTLWNGSSRNTADNYTYDGPIRVSNQDLYAKFKVSQIANKYYWQAYIDGYITYQEYYDMYYVFEPIVTYDRADSRLSNVCNAARNNGVTIYAIGVEAPQAGLDAMRDCASSAAHYYDVTGSQLEQTFANIARTMSILRLTQ